MRSLGARHVLCTVGTCRELSLSARGCRQIEAHAPTAGHQMTAMAAFARVSRPMSQKIAAGTVFVSLLR